MRTRFAAEALARPEIAAAEREIRRCVHCGFCLATCPSYVVLGDERDSPRGRIRIIQEMLERRGPPSAEAISHVDRCLSCLACETTCPSGVVFSTLIDQARVEIEASGARPPWDRLWRGLIARVLPHPSRLRTALSWARFARPIAGLLARAPALRPLAAMLELAPAHPPAPAEPVILPRAGARPRAIIMAGCVEPILRPEIRAATLRLVERMGVTAGCTASEGCCGALSLHLGRQAEALACARRNIAAWTREIEAAGLEAIVATASGCGTMIKDYGRLLDGEPAWRARAKRVSTLARDIGEFLEEKGPPPRLGHADPLIVAYLAPCSLQHAQKAAAPMRRVLEAAGFEVVEPKEAHLCCGSAGSYNILQRPIASALKARKAERLTATGAKVFAAGNIGCLTQIGAAARMPGVHPVELIDWATGGPRPLRLGG